MEEVSEKVKLKFWSKVNKVGIKLDHMNTRCWEWTGAVRKRDGYGAGWDGKQVRVAHQISWMFSGKLKHQNICHKCDNRLCVRPSHLYEGTQADNVRDTFRRGRSAQQKILEAQAVEIITLLYEGDLTHSDIGQLFGLSRCAVSDISHGRSWGWLPKPWNKPPRKSLKVSDREIEAMRLAREQGGKYKDIGLKFGVTGAYVCMLCMRHTKR